MRIGIFGGSFDPVHVGHLILADQAREQARLDQVWFIPAFRQPLKDGQTVTRFEQRAEMLALAVAGHDAFRIDELEKERPGPSYTVDTLALLHQRHPDDAFFLLIGGDSLADLHLWRDVRGILARAGLVVMARAGSSLPSVEQMRETLALPEEQPISMQVIDAPLIEISSRDLRQRVLQGRSVRYFVPRAVEVYIQEKGLYRPEK